MCLQAFIFLYVSYLKQRCVADQFGQTFMNFSHDTQYFLFDVWLFEWFKFVGTILHLLQCLIEVGNDVVDMLHSDGQTHRRRGDMLLGQFLLAEV